MLRKNLVQRMIHNNYYQFFENKPICKYTKKQQEKTQTNQKPPTFNQTHTCSTIYAFDTPILQYSLQHSTMHQLFNVYPYLFNLSDLKIFPGCKEGRKITSQQVNDRVQ